MSDRDDDWFERAIEGDDRSDGQSDSDDEENVPQEVDELLDSGGPEDDGSDDGSLFEDDFASALENVDVPDVGGGPGGGGFGDVELPDEGDAGFETSTEEFDDEEFESDIDRVDLGIDGLDQMIQGGVPERSLMVAIGSAGCGKTTFGLQFLAKGLAEGERGVFIALDESGDRVIRSATEKGFPFDEYLEENQLAIVDIDPVDMVNSLQSIQSELPHLIDEFGASRLVLDSVSLLEMMYDDRATRRNEIYDFSRSLKRAGVTTMMTSEADDTNPYASRHGIIEYLTDAVFVLRYVRPNDFQETRMAIEIQKIRDARHSRAIKPYEITDEGISVYQQATLF